MKYLKYLAVAIPIEGLLYVLMTLTSSTAAAKQFVLVTFPLAIWSGRLVISYRNNAITRRIPMLDGGETLSGVFWSFTPDVYVRQPGFDNFKGYFFKETMVCLLLWAMFISVAVQRILA